MGQCGRSAEGGVGGGGGAGGGGLGTRWRPLNATSPKLGRVTLVAWGDETHIGPGTCGGGAGGELDMWAKQGWRRSGW